MNGEPVTVSYAGVEQLADIETVWWTLHAHHIETDYPRHGQLRAERQTWESRSPQFAELLQKPEAFLVLAVAEGGSEAGTVSGADEVVGYALVHFQSSAGNWRITGERYAELESLAVLPTYRGRGIGERIMQAVYARMRELDVQELSVRVVHANEGANRFYQRLGFQPWHATYAGPIPDPPG